VPRVAIHRPNVRRPLAVALAGGAVVALSELPRILAASDLLPSSLGWLGWSDLLATFVIRGLAGGHRPYFDVPFEYPPLIGYPAGLFATISSSPGAYVGWWAVVIVAAGTATTYLLARESGPQRALYRWVLAPQLLLFAGMNMDLLPVGLTVVAVVASRQRRPVGAMVALALGAATKLFPALVAPALLVREGRRAWQLVSAFIATIAILFLPSLFAAHSSASGIAFYVTGYDASGIAVWGLVRTALDGLGVPNAAHLVLVLTTAGLAGTYLFAVAPRSRAAEDPVVGVSLAVIAVLFWSRLFSPQFSLWVLPFFALMPTLSGRTFAVLAAADTTVFVGVSQLTLVQRDPLDTATTLLVLLVTVAVVLRHVALIRMWREVSRSARLVRADGSDLSGRARRTT